MDKSTRKKYEAVAKQRLPREEAAREQLLAQVARDTYGARVMDGRDRAVLESLIAEILADSQAGSEKPVLALEPGVDWADLQAIPEPALESAADIALSPNVEFSIMQIVSGPALIAALREDDEPQETEAILNEALTALPAPLPIETEPDEFPFCLKREAIHLNVVLNSIRCSLTALLTLEDDPPMELAAMMATIDRAAVPEEWWAPGFPTTKTLPAFLDDVTNRVKYLSAWWQQGGWPAELKVGLLAYPSGCFTERLRVYAKASEQALEQELPAHTLSWKLIPATDKDRGKVYGKDTRLHPLTCTGLIMTGARFVNEAVNDLNPTDFGNFSVPPVDLLPWVPVPAMSKGMTSVMIYRDTTRAEEVLEVTIKMKDPGSAIFATIWRLQGISLATQE
jgi:hypothetical protein